MKVVENETVERENFFTTTASSLVNWARKGSLWPYPFGTACCAIEFMATVSSHYDLARFGSEVVRFAPKQSDVLMVLGTIAVIWMISFIIDPQGVIQLVEITSEGVGRNAAELLRKIKAAQYVAAHPGEVCPAKWEEGDETLAPSLDLVGKL